MRFVKVEGLGNDFVLIDRRDDDDWRQDLAVLAAAAPALCHRRTGIGADGLLVLGPSLTAAATMVVLNFDGSRPEMCGNGLRTVAHHIAHKTGELEFAVTTDAGDLDCTVSDLSERAAQVRVNMGPARRGEVLQPAAGQGRTFTNVSMGNPHAITFVGADEDPQALAAALGPELERDPLYPERTNVEFAQVRTDGGLTLWVWERGCGITQACGTGACATAAAAADRGLATVGAPTVIVLPGGTLHVEVPRETGAGLKMTGPARRVFAGQVALDAFSAPVGASNQA